MATAGTKKQTGPKKGPGARAAKKGAQQAAKQNGKAAEVAAADQAIDQAKNGTKEPSAAVKAGTQAIQDAAATATGGKKISVPANVVKNEIEAKRAAKDEKPAPAGRRLPKPESVKEVRDVLKSMEQLAIAADEGDTQAAKDGRQRASQLWEWYKARVTS